MKISRTQVINRLRDAGFSYKTTGKKVDIYKEVGGPQRIDLSRRKNLEERYVRIVLKQAGLGAEEIDVFIAEAIKD